MIQSKRALIIGLLIPILVLAALASYKKFLPSSGQEIILPISGYDPRDLLSGHYLIYQIDYGVSHVCSGNQGKQAGYICLEPKQFSYILPTNCSKLIQGLCNFGRFEAGIEKFYIPEENAQILEEQVRNHGASISLSIAPNGKAQIKDLLVNGRPWKSQ